MKKMVTLVLALLVLAVSLAGCGNSNANKQASLSSVEKNQTPLPSTEVSPTTKEGKKALVVYFSLPETTKPDNMTKEEANSTVIVDGKVLGNTQYVAYLIQANTGADIFRIEPKTPYPTDHKTLVALAKEEQKNKTRPELAARIENLDQYKVIFLGYPNWWGDMPMVVYSFLESHDLSGKTIIPFNTHGGSGFSNTINTLAAVQPKAAIVKNGFSVSRDTVQNCAEDVASWVKELQY